LPSADSGHGFRVDVQVRAMEHKAWMSARQSGLGECWEIIAEDGIFLVSLRGGQGSSLEVPCGVVVGCFRSVCKARGLCRRCVSESTAELSS